MWNHLKKLSLQATKKGSLSLFTNDSREYEYGENKLWVTLLATTDSLGKPNLMYRPGRASGDTTKKRAYHDGYTRCTIIRSKYSV